MRHFAIYSAFGSVRWRECVVRLFRMLRCSTTQSHFGHVRASLLCACVCACGYYCSITAREPFAGGPVIAYIIIVSLNKTRTHWRTNDLAASLCSFGLLFSAFALLQTQHECSGDIIHMRVFFGYNVDGDGDTIADNIFIIINIIIIITIVCSCDRFVDVLGRSECGWAFVVCRASW